MGGYYVIGVIAIPYLYYESSNLLFQWMINPTMFSFPISCNTRALNSPRWGQYVFCIFKKKTKKLYFKHIIHSMQGRIQQQTISGWMIMVIWEITLTNRHGYSYSLELKLTLFLVLRECWRNMPRVGINKMEWVKRWRSRELGKSKLAINIDYEWINRMF